MYKQRQTTTPQLVWRGNVHGHVKSCIKLSIVHHIMLITDCGSISLHCANFLIGVRNARLLNPYKCLSRIPEQFNLAFIHENGSNTS